MFRQVKNMQALIIEDSPEIIEAISLLLKVYLPGIVITVTTEEIPSLEKLKTGRLK